MRRIKNECLSKMKSPIRFVMNHIHEAIVNIAPENKKRFEEEYPNFTIEYVDSKMWVLDVDTNNNLIKISRKVVEIFWAVSYGYITFYTKVVQKKMVIKKTVVNLYEIKEVREAMQLLKWVYESWINNDDDDWPDNLPKPIENPQKGTMEKVSDELSLSAIAYVMHHELSHIRLKHEGGSNIENEKEADNEATDWILNHSLDEWDDMFVKRSIGIAIAFEVLTAKGIYTGNFGGVTHPFTYDRLYNTLVRYITDPNHIVWALVASTLKLHLDNAKISTLDVVYKDFHECVNAYIDLLSKR